MTLNLRTFSLCQVLDSEVMNFKLYKPQAHLDILKKLPSELLMNGIDCLRHYCTVVHYRHFKSDLIVFKESEYN